MRVSDEREEERFKRLDEVIRAYQRETRGERKQRLLRQGGFHFSGPV